MESLIKKLQECTTLGQADPILTQLDAGPAVKKLVETAIILSNSQDPAQRSHAFTFMETAIKELESRNEGSHQSSSTYHPKKAINVKGGMQGATGTQNQMTGEFAQKIKAQTNDSITNYNNSTVKPMIENFKKELDAQTADQEERDDDISNLKKQSEELKNDTSLDIAGITELIRSGNKVQETTENDWTPIIDVRPYTDRFPIETARREINEMDKMLMNGNRLPSE